MKHYVYRLDNFKTGEFYFGSRSCKCKPSEDEYMGSMKTWKPNKSDLVKTILFECESRKEANDYEFKLISEHKNDSLNRNYHSNKNFCTHGTTRKTESHHFYGKKLTKEHKEKISKNNSRYWLNKKRPNQSEMMKEKSPTKGKQHPISTINKMKQKSKGRFTLDWYIKKFGETEGTNEYNKRAISLSERNKKMYSDKSKHPNFGKTGKNNKTSKKIYQYTMDNQLVKIWDGMSEAARELGLQTSNISSCCNGKIKSTGGYIWKKIN